MRCVAAAILGISGSVHTSSLAAQRTTDSARAMPVEGREFERLGREVRASLVASPERFSHERFGKFVELQAARGDLEGARESARQGPRWYPFARLAIVQYKAGDLDGAITTTRMAATFTDRALPDLQEGLLSKMPQLAYAGAVDNNGYFPTHNKKFSQPLTGNYDVDIVNNRTKRIFNDRTGTRCGSNTKPFLLQTYKRDTGEVMHDLSAPIYVDGQHWGGFRVGYRSSAA